ncbi:MAG: hypothetical protein FWG23_04820 [Eggerthellaceae bacterium]|jgi:hypothetical protein|nr:hypothetical protein [Eggerthellaceae bacterium]
MQGITIDQEFKDLLPALDKETYTLLEENILKHGCRDSLVLWNGILIDGHNRYAICTEHGIPFDTVDKDFASREEVLIWIVSTQVARRNLTSLQLSHYRGLHYRADKKLVTNTKGKNQHSEMSAQTKNLANPQVSEVEPHNEGQPRISSTSERLAGQYKVSRATIERDAKVATTIDAIGEASPEAKKKILSGEVSIDKKELEALAAGSSREIAKLAKSIEGGTYEKKRPTAPASGRDKEQPGVANTGTQATGTLIGEITEGFQTELQWHTEKGDAAGLKAALRTYLDRLEGIYRQI